MMAFGDRDTEANRRFLERGRESSARTLQASSRKSAREKPRRQQPVSPASPAQRAKVNDHGACIVCGDEFEGRMDLDPAHLIDRSLCADPDGDPLRVVPLCRVHHREYDEQGLDLSAYLEPAWRDEVAEAVRLIGAWAALNRITNRRWVEDDRRAAA